MKNISLSFVVFLLLTFIMYGCTTNNSTATSSLIFKDISIEEAAELIKNNDGNPDFTILDVRTPGEFRTGHIENAVNLDFYAADFEDQLNNLDKTNKYLVYCRSGNRSGQAMKIMQSLDFREVYNLSYGITDWEASGYPTVK